MTDQTPRPDPVTEARDEAVYRALLMLTGDTPRPAAPHEFVRLLEQDGYTVRALVRAEAGVSAAVEALADVRARRSTFATAEAFDSAMLEAAWNILAARSAKENDHD